MGFGLLLLIAILQGLTEFLPVSSSGHLTLAAEWFDLQFQGEDREAYFVLLHVASLLATCWWLRRDLFELVTDSTRRSELVAIAVGTVPAAALGLWLKQRGSGDLFDSLPLVAGGWLVSAALLFATRFPKGEGWRFAHGGWSMLPVLAIGCAQALAIVPGVSRSGATIAVALLCGMARAEAFRFSFLISIPVIAGATLVNAGSLAHVAAVAGPGPLAATFVVCLVVSLLALAALRRAVLSRWLHWFAPYCLVAAAVALFLSR